ncbi:MAG: hypothetical protein WBW33_16605 [Bryobacteraceae bacterium]
MNRLLATGLLATCLFAAPATIPTGPEVGSAAPYFSTVDQFGKTQSLRTVLGPKGALLVFYRSADW